MTAAAAPARTLNDIATALGAQLVGDGGVLVRGVAHPAMAAADMLALAVEDGAEKLLARTKAITPPSPKAGPRPWPASKAASW